MSAIAYVMVGPPGAGKSTFSQTLSSDHNAIILSGDDIRHELYGNAAIQGNWSEIWDRMDELVAENSNRSLVIDGTHCYSNHRQETLTLLQSYGYTDVRAVVIQTPLEECLGRNAKRSRKVPEHVIHRMHKELERNVKGIGREGFSSVLFA